MKQEGFIYELKNHVIKNIKEDIKNNKEVNPIAYLVCDKNGNKTIAVVPMMVENTHQFSMVLKGLIKEKHEELGIIGMVFISDCKMNKYTAPKEGMSEEEILKMYKEGKIKRPLEDNNSMDVIICIVETDLKQENYSVEYIRSDDDIVFSEEKYKLSEFSITEVNNTNLNFIYNKAILEI